MKQSGRANIYVLTQSHMDRLDELIMEIQAVYCDIFSNRHLTVTTGLERTPGSALVNAVVENNITYDDLTTN